MNRWMTHVPGIHPFIQPSQILEILAGTMQPTDFNQIMLDYLFLDWYFGEDWTKSKPFKGLKKHVRNIFLELFLLLSNGFHTSSSNFAVPEKFPTVYVMLCRLLTGILIQMLSFVNFLMRKIHLIYDTQTRTSTPEHSLAEIFSSILQQNLTLLRNCQSQVNEKRSKIKIFENPEKWK